MAILKEQTKIIPGPAGDIELRHHQGQADKPIVIVCHPHSLHGGSMDNKVVHTLIKVFAELGLSTLRFNFRGVGNSQGHYDEGQGESEDLHQVASWLRQQHPGQPLWLAGFSFGAYVALRAQHSLKVEQLCLVAPPVSLYDFTILPDVKIPWMVIQGGEDEIIDPDAVADWLESRKARPQVVWCKEAGHFFHGKLNLVKNAVIQAAQRVLN